ncbi:MAG: heavy metal-associated domain-containing protein [Cyclobacteriaceae bacterium]
MKISVTQFVLLLILSLPQYLLAGIKWVDIGVDGLTCSMCSRSVELSVRRLDFIDNVTMSLEKTEGRVYLKSGQPIDLKKIARAVTDAGFSVRFLRVEFDFNDITIKSDGSFDYQGQPYVWIDFKDGSAKGNVVLQLVDEGFLPRKESTPWKKRIAPDKSRQKVFHVIQV